MNVILPNQLKWVLLMFTSGPSLCVTHFHEVCPGPSSSLHLMWSFRLAALFGWWQKTIFRSSPLKVTLLSQGRCASNTVALVTKCLPKSAVAQIFNPKNAKRITCTTRYQKRYCLGWIPSCFFTGKSSLCCYKRDKIQRRKSKGNRFRKKDEGTFCLGINNRNYCFEKGRTGIKKSRNKPWDYMKNFVLFFSASHTSF